MTNIIAIDGIADEGTISKVKDLVHGETHKAGYIIYRRVDDNNTAVEYSNDWADYKFASTEIVGKFTVKKEVTANDIDIVVTGAIEDCATNWFYLLTEDPIWLEKPDGLPYSTWATRLILRGTELKVEDRFTEREYTLTLDKLLKGIKLNSIKRDFDRDIGNGDAVTFDCIVQYAIFGDVVYS